MAFNRSWDVLGSVVLPKKNKIVSRSGSYICFFALALAEETASGRIVNASLERFLGLKDDAGRGPFYELEME